MALLHTLILLQGVVATTRSIRGCINAVSSELSEPRNSTAIFVTYITELRNTLATLLESRSVDESGRFKAQADVRPCPLDRNRRSNLEEHAYLLEVHRINRKIQQDMLIGLEWLADPMDEINSIWGQLCQSLLPQKQVLTDENMDGCNKQMQASRKKSTPVRKQRPPLRGCRSVYRAQESTPHPPVIPSKGAHNSGALVGQSGVGSVAGPEDVSTCSKETQPHEVGDTGSALYVPSFGQNNSSANRNTLRRGKNTLKIGTLNLNGLSKNSLFRKLQSATNLMNREGIQILAVQETRLRSSEDANLWLHGLGYQLIQHPARETEKLRLSSGTGFIVKTAIARRFSWVDIRNPHPYTTRWGRVDFGGETRPIFVGCIYLPDSSRRQTRPEEFQQSLNILQQDITRFSVDGEVLILGDFNVQVGTRGCSKTAEVFEKIPPRFGTKSMTPRYGKDILQLVKDTGLCFLSGSEPTPSPQTFQRVSMRRGSVSCSVIDHIIASQQLSGNVSQTITIPFDTQEIREGNFDHTVVYTSFRVKMSVE